LKLDLVHCRQRLRDGWHRAEQQYRQKF